MSKLISESFRGRPYVVFIALLRLVTKLAILVSFCLATSRNVGFYVPNSIIFVFRFVTTFSLRLLTSRSTVGEQPFPVQNRGPVGETG